MEPELSQNRTKRLQMIVTVGLTLVLIAIVAAYVYFGMMRAGEVTPEGEEVTVPVAEAPAEPQLSTEEKMKILQQLSEGSTTTLTQAEKEAILQNLQNAPAVDMTASMDGVQ